MSKVVVSESKVFLGSEEEYLPEEWRSSPGFEPPSLQHTQCYSCGGLLVDLLAMVHEGDARETAASAAKETNPLRIPKADDGRGRVLSFPIVPGSKAKGA